MGSASGQALDPRTTSSPAPLPGIPMQAGWDRSGVPLWLGGTCHPFGVHWSLSCSHRVELVWRCSTCHLLTPRL